MAATSLDRWRDYFRGANSDIFDIIEHAITVAADDRPCDFKARRNRIAELLLATNRDRVQLGDGLDKSEDIYKSGIESGGSRDDDRGEAMEMDVNREEALRIKEILDKSEENSVLLDNLRKLLLMHLSVQDLKATAIGKSVNALRKHGWNEIRKLAKTLVRDWKFMVDSWLEEEERLPSPRPDEGAFIAAPTSTKPPSSGSGPGPRRPKFIIKYKGKIVAKIEQKSNKGVIPQKLRPPQLEKSKDKDDGSIRMNLEVAKRKLQERYREVENAKKQRRIQVLELWDLPKQSLAARNQHIRPRNHNRNSANRRR